MKLKLGYGELCINMHMYPPSSIYGPNKVNLGSMGNQETDGIMKP
jgi:hypothetical protein